MPYHHLSRSERGRIALLRNQKQAIRTIALQLGRSPSTITREIKRNTRTERYRADAAQIGYQERRKNSCRTKFYDQPEICGYVTEKLLLAWSPEQIAGRMKLEKLPVCVSFSSIYRWLNAGLMPRAILLKENLRRFRRRRRPKKSDPRADARSIRSRGKDILRRNRYGDWEADTISFGMFPNQTYLLNINERKSKYCALVLLRNIKRDEVMRAFTLTFEGEKLPLKTMTSDRGMEFNCHNEFEKAFLTPYYYTDKGKPWQKPTVENTNSLLRQFLPRGTNIREISEECIQTIMDSLNNRPRKSLGFKTPAEVLHLP